jgi:hypothetical protein
MRTMANRRSLGRAIVQLTYIKLELQWARRSQGGPDGMAPCRERVVLAQPELEPHDL